MPPTGADLPPNDLTRQSDGDTLRRLRALILFMLLGGIATTLAELLLSEHTEELNQFIPVALLAIGLPLVLLCARFPARTTLLTLRSLMGMYAVSGFFGVWLHLSAKMEFALEAQPDLAGWTLFKESLEGTSPPILAPLAMTGLALLGFAWTYRFPRKSRHTTPHHSAT